MKVGVYYNNEDVRVEEMPAPEVRDNDVLIKVMASGICGSDVMEWYRIKKAPLVLGHEVAGKIVDVGKNINKYKVGDRVFATHHIPCDECHYCLNGHETTCETFQTKNNFYPGGFSEYLRVSGKSLDTGILKLPDDLSYEKASFIEPLGTVVRGLRKLDLKPKDNVLVLGSGIAGLLNISLARTIGVGKIIATDIKEYRLYKAVKFGADICVDANFNVPKLIKETNNGKLVDKVVVATGALPAVYQALKSVDKGGSILFFAVPKPREKVSVDFNYYWKNDISFKTSYGAAPRDNKEALDLINSGKINVKDMITQRLSLDEIAKGFDLVSKGENCFKVIIEPHKNK